MYLLMYHWGCGVFASCCRGFNYSSARAMDGRISAAAPLALADQLSLPIIVKPVRFPYKTRYVKITGFSFLAFSFWGK